ncbi:hypothetical protein [Natrinema sp. 1APR25-10V2]|uniref:hypothetical protein n=1 Tax=Natrinema sp. 1APR25-10V2 TaxID=2951081 RepID=UPI0028745039|nr:hypothetical protein [Natrinema sp. 1APR25-10V2]MDS0473789.1 hypothetical protein [Natrinema sp. 1APR25-10V2]
MTDENPFEGVKSAEEVFNELNQQFQEIDDVDALEIQRNLLSNSPVVEDDEGKYTVAHLTLAQKFLEITRGEKQIERWWDEYADQLDPDDFPDHAHPQRLAAMGRKTEKRKELADDIILLFSLGQEVIDQHMVQLCITELSSSAPSDLDQERTMENGDIKEHASDLKDEITQNTDTEKIAREKFSRIQREKYLYYRGVIDKTLHDRLQDIRTNIRNSLIHNVDDRHTLDPVKNIERDCRDCIGVINRLSRIEQDEIAIPVSRSSGETIVFDP